MAKFLLILVGCVVTATLGAYGICKYQDCADGQCCPHVFTSDSKQVCTPNSCCTETSAENTAAATSGDAKKSGCCEGNKEDCCEAGKCPAEKKEEAKKE